jgi:hypothetical protein
MLEPDDLKNKLIIGGFLNHPYGAEQDRCMECMYYLVHRKWCDLPELAVPVEAEWWCRLWRNDCPEELITLPRFLRPELTSAYFHFRI